MNDISPSTYPKRKLIDCVERKIRDFRDENKVNTDNIEAIEEINMLNAIIDIISVQENDCMSCSNSGTVFCNYLMTCEYWSKNTDKKKPEGFEVGEK